MKSRWHKRDTVDNTLNATHNLLAAIVESRQDIHVVHLGTMGVYGDGTAKRQSRMLDEMHETVRGLHGAGLISKRRMSEFDALCHLDVHEMPPQHIRGMREQARVSQAVFAAILNISPSTVQKWEAGDKKPSGSSLKLLNLIERKGLEAIL